MAKQDTEQTVENLEVDVQIEKTEAFIQKNKNILTGVIAAIVILAVGGFFLKQSKASAEEEAQKSIYAAQYYFGLDSLDLVLNGDGNNVIGVLEIAEDYSGTKAGNLANYYAGAVLLKKGEYEEAISYLEQFSSSDLLVQSRAYSLIGDANMELDNVEEAKTYYEKAASNEANKQYSPRYLLKLALAFEKAGELPDAINTYDQIITKYYTTEEANKAKKYKAYLQAKVDSK